MTDLTALVGHLPAAYAEIPGSGTCGLCDWPDQRRCVADSICDLLRAGDTAHEVVDEFDVWPSAVYEVAWWTANLEVELLRRRIPRRDWGAVVGEI